MPTSPQHARNERCTSYVSSFPPAAPELSFQSLEDGLSGELVNFPVPGDSDLGAATPPHLVAPTRSEEAPCRASFVGGLLNPFLELNLPQPPSV